MSQREKQARQEELKRKREEIAYQVLKACYILTSAREYARAVRQGVDEAQENLRVANLRYANGLGQYADTLRAATALTQIQQRRNVADKNLTLAQQYLGLLLASSERVDVNDAALDLPLHALDIYQQSASSRSDLGAAVLRSENARQNIRLAEAGFWPYLGVGGTYQFNDHDQLFGSEGKSWQVAAFMRWELFDGTKRSYERAKAAYLSEQARESLATLRQGIDYRIFEAYANVQEAQANSALARQAKQSAEEGARLVRVRYTNGLASLADLLSAQAALEESRAGIVERENATRTAQAALSYESGTILTDLNIQD
jgi:outer membrane protein